MERRAVAGERVRRDVPRTQGAVRTVARSREGACDRADDQRQAGRIVRAARRSHRDRAAKIIATHSGLARHFCYIALARLTLVLRDRSAAPALLTSIRV